MRQKIGIIQALQHDPELAILDEPTEGLDPLMQHAFLSLLDERRAGGPDGLLLVARAVRGGARVRPRGHHPERAAGRPVERRRRSWRIAGGTSRCASRAPCPGLEGVPGVSAIEVRDGVLRCDLEGDVGPFLAAIAGATVRDLTIEPARLEEAFLEYYAPDAGVDRA